MSGNTINNSQNQQTLNYNQNIGLPLLLIYLAIISMILSYCLLVLHEKLLAMVISFFISKYLKTVTINIDRVCLSLFIYCIRLDNVKVLINKSTFIEVNQVVVKFKLKNRQEFDSFDISSNPKKYFYARFECVSIYLDTKSLINNSDYNKEILEFLKQFSINSIVDLWYLNISFCYGEGLNLYASFQIKQLLLQNGMFKAVHTSDTITNENFVQFFNSQNYNHDIEYSNNNDCTFKVNYLRFQVFNMKLYLNQINYDYISFLNKNYLLTSIEELNGHLIIRSDFQQMPSYKMKFFKIINEKMDSREKIYKPAIILNLKSKENFNINIDLWNDLFLTLPLFISFFKEIVFKHENKIQEVNGNHVNSENLITIILNLDFQRVDINLTKSLELTLIRFQISEQESHSNGYSRLEYVQQTSLKKALQLDKINLTMKSLKFYSFLNKYPLFETDNTINLHIYESMNKYEAYFKFESPDSLSKFNLSNLIDNFSLFELILSKYKAISRHFVYRVNNSFRRSTLLNQLQSVKFNIIFNHTKFNFLTSRNLDSSVIILSVDNFNLKLMHGFRTEEKTEDFLLKNRYKSILIVFEELILTSSDNEKLAFLTERLVFEILIGTIDTKLQLFTTPIVSRLESHNPTFSNSKHNNKSNYNQHAIYISCIQLRQQLFYNNEICYSNQIEIIIGDIVGTLEFDCLINLVNLLNSMLIYTLNELNEHKSLFIYKYCFKDDYNIVSKELVYNSLRFITSILHVNILNVEKSIAINLIISTFRYAICDLHVQNGLPGYLAIIPDVYVRFFYNLSDLKWSECGLIILKHLYLLNAIPINNDEHDIKLNFLLNSDENTKRLKFFWVNKIDEHNKQSKSCISSQTTLASSSNYNDKYSFNSKLSYNKSMLSINIKESNFKFIGCACNGYSEFFSNSFNKFNFYINKDNLVSKPCIYDSNDSSNSDGFKFGQSILSPNIHALYSYKKFNDILDSNLNTNTNCILNNNERAIVILWFNENSFYTDKEPIFATPPLESLNNKSSYEFSLYMLCQPFIKNMSKYEYNAQNLENSINITNNLRDCNKSAYSDEDDFIPYHYPTSVSDAHNVDSETLSNKTDNSSSNSTIKIEINSKLSDIASETHNLASVSMSSLKTDINSSLFVESLTSSSNQLINSSINTTQSFDSNLPIIQITDELVNKTQPTPDSPESTPKFINSKSNLMNSFNLKLKKVKYCKKCKKPKSPMNILKIQINQRKSELSHKHNKTCINSQKFKKINETFDIRLEEPNYRKIKIKSKTLPIPNKYLRSQTKSNKNKNNNNNTDKNENYFGNMFNLEFNYNQLHPTLDFSDDAYHELKQPEVIKIQITSFVYQNLNEKRKFLKTIKNNIYNQLLNDLNNKEDTFGQHTESNVQIANIPIFKFFKCSFIVTPTSLSIINELKAEYNKKEQLNNPKIKLPELNILIKQINLNVLWSDRSVNTQNDKSKNHLIKLKFQNMSINRNKLELDNLIIDNSMYSNSRINLNDTITQFSMFLFDFINPNNFTRLYKSYKSYKFFINKFEIFEIFDKDEITFINMPNFFISLSFKNDLLYIKINFKNLIVLKPIPSYYLASLAVIIFSLKQNWNLYSMKKSIKSQLQYQFELKINNLNLSFFNLINTNELNKHIKSALIKIRSKKFQFLFTNQFEEQNFLYKLMATIIFDIKLTNVDSINYFYSQNYENNTFNVLKTFCMKMKFEKRVLDFVIILKIFNSSFDNFSDSDDDESVEHVNETTTNQTSYLNDSKYTLNFVFPLIFKSKFEFLNETESKLRLPGVLSYMCENNKIKTLLELIEIKLLFNNQTRQINIIANKMRFMNAFYRNSFIEYLENSLFGVIKYKPHLYYSINISIGEFSYCHFINQFSDKKWFFIRLYEFEMLFEIMKKRENQEIYNEITINLSIEHCKNIYKQHLRDIEMLQNNNHANSLSSSYIEMYDDENDTLRDNRKLLNPNEREFKLKNSIVMYITSRNEIKKDFNLNDWLSYACIDNQYAYGYKVKVIALLPKIELEFNLNSFLIDKHTKQYECQLYAHFKHNLFIDIKLFDKLINMYNQQYKQYYYHDQHIISSQVYKYLNLKLNNLNVYDFNNQSMLVNDFNRFITNEINIAYIFNTNFIQLFSSIHKFIDLFQINN